MREWLVWLFVKGKMKSLLDKLKILTHPGVTYSAYAAGAAEILYGVSGYAVDGLTFDQAMEHVKTGFEVLFFTSVGNTKLQK